MIMGMEDGALTTPPNSPINRKVKHLRNASLANAALALDHSYPLYTEYQKARTILSHLLAQVELSSFLLYYMKQFDNDQRLQLGEKYFDWPRIKEEFDIKPNLLNAKKYVAHRISDTEDEYIFFILDFPCILENLPDILQSKLQNDHRLLLTLLDQELRKNNLEGTWQNTWLSHLKRCMNAIQSSPDQKIIEKIIPDLANLIANYQLLSLDPKASYQLEVGALFELPTHNIINPKVRSRRTSAYT